MPAIIKNIRRYGCPVQGGAVFPEEPKRNFRRVKLLSTYMDHNPFLLRYQTLYQPNLIHRLVKQTSISVNKSNIFEAKILDDENSFQQKCNEVSNLIGPIRDYKYADVGEADVFAHECEIVMKRCSNVCLKQTNGRRSQNFRYGPD